MGADGGGARHVARPSWFPHEGEPRLEDLEKVVPVIGSGISRGAHLEDGRQLAEWIRTLGIATGVPIPAGREDEAPAPSTTPVSRREARAASTCAMRGYAPLASARELLVHRHFRYLPRRDRHEPAPAALETVSGASLSRVRIPVPPLNCLS